MQGSGFPPLGHLPHWPRAGQPERPGRPYAPADAPPPPPPPPPLAPASRAAAELERSLHFLQQQHGETLRQLHQEIDRLKRRNQDLQYRLIMHPLIQQAGFLSADSEGSLARQSKGKWAGRLKAAEGPREDSEELGQKRADRECPLEVETAEEGSVEGEREPEGLDLESEEAEVAAPARFANAGGRPLFIPLPACTRAQDQQHFLSGSLMMPSLNSVVDGDAAVCDRTTSPIPYPRSGQSRAGDVKVPAVSSNPFLVNVLPSYMRKPPSLEECEVVIRQLWNINHMQMQELMYLRTCLDDIHKTKRIPEDYMLAGQLGSQESMRLPRVRNVPKKCRILTPLPAAERAVLPALKQTLGNAFAERQKRAQAIQRNRLHRTAL
ncbi:coiled-coil domain-containing protein 74B [Candoia aspera]|uniref:coiled-coil domain-containing protein 74B n=1 Tax=Candoia aspera TaxID=51853 RepID=UPI002FD803CD